MSDAKTEKIKSRIDRRFNEMVSGKAHGELRIVFVDGRVTRIIRELGDDPQELKELQTA